MKSPPGLLRGLAPAGRGFARGWGPTAVAAFGVTILVTLLSPLTFLENVELSLLDMRFRWRGPEEPHPEITVVAIDQTSESDLDQHYPWDRRYHARLVDNLARAGARYASTHGAQYRVDHRLPVGTTAVWEEDIGSDVLPQCSGLDPSKLTVTAAWSAGNNEANAADADTDFTSTVKNTVTVTVSYQWFPEGYLSEPVTFTSSATMPMTY